MKKYILTILIISLFVLTGCGNKNAPVKNLENIGVNRRNAIGQAKKTVKILDKKTEDQLAQEDFEKLISEPQKQKKNTKEIKIKGANPEDIEILDVTTSELNLIN